MSAAVVLVVGNDYQNVYLPKIVTTWQMDRNTDELTNTRQSDPCKTLC